VLLLFLILGFEIQNQVEGSCFPYHFYPSNLRFGVPRRGIHLYPHFNSLKMNRADEEPKKKRKKPDLPIVSIKSTADYQRMKLERLMANPDKPVMIPSKPKERNQQAPPDFVRNIMGSRAGAGSGEFHVYRHLRRKEYARQKNIQEQAKKEELEVEFRKKVEERQKSADEKAAKRKAKSLKKKAAKQRNRAKGKGPPKKESSSSSSESDSADKVESAEGQLSLPVDTTSTTPVSDVIASIPKESVKDSGSSLPAAEDDASTNLVSDPDPETVAVVLPER